MNRAFVSCSRSICQKDGLTSWIASEPAMSTATFMFFKEPALMPTDAILDTLNLGRGSRFVRLLKLSALFVTLFGAIPTAITAYNAWTFGVPFSEVPHRLQQYELWVKNLDCKIEYKALATAQGTRVDVGACAKSGDIALKISTPDGKSNYEWIAYNSLTKPGEKSSLSFMDLLIGAARAGSDTGGTFKVAQAAMDVKCQSLEGKKIVRVVSEGGKCFREVVSPLKGTVETREEVPCETQCK